MPISFGDDFDSYECLKRKVEEIEHNFNCLFVIDSSKVVENMNLYHSGLVVARLPVVQEVPGTNLHCRNFLCFSLQLLQFEALGMGCTLSAVPRSTQPFTL